MALTRKNFVYIVWLFPCTVVIFASMPLPIAYMFPDCSSICVCGHQHYPVGLPLACSSCLNWYELSWDLERKEGKTGTKEQKERGRLGEGQIDAPIPEQNILQRNITRKACDAVLCLFVYHFCVCFSCILLLFKLYSCVLKFKLMMMMIMYSETGGAKCSWHCRSHWLCSRQSAVNFVCWMLRVKWTNV